MRISLTFPDIISLLFLSPPCAVSCYVTQLLLTWAWQAPGTQSDLSTTLPEYSSHMKLKRCLYSQLVWKLCLSKATLFTRHSFLSFPGSTNSTSFLCRSLPSHSFILHFEAKFWVHTILKTAQHSVQVLTVDLLLSSPGTHCAFSLVSEGSLTYWLA